MTQDFLLEIGCEELPPKSLKKLAQALAEGIKQGLDKAHLNHAQVSYLASPRRFAVMVTELSAEQPDSSVERRGPSVVAAFDGDDKPTKAALGFARSCGVEFDQLSRLKTDKGEWLAYQAQIKGRSCFELMPEIVNHAIGQLPIPKPMRWGANTTEFVRPVHWVVMLYGSEIIETTVLGVATGRQTHGHRFHHPQAMTIDEPASYEKVLHDGKVVVDFDARQSLIKQQISALCDELDATAVMPQALLDEVTAIVEWPQALLASFDEAFLKVPAEALIAAMQGHQKSFALRDKQGQLMPYFITVSNIESTNPAQVIAGNQKVMKARLSDAAFFFEQDTSHSLAHWLEATKKVVFQASLGSLYDKTQRVLSNALAMSEQLHVDKDLVSRAAQLSKCDLMTDMVGEFPELQGIMGYHYANHDGEPAEVAHAMNEQYKPRFSGDELPIDDLSAVMSMADRLDTLVGIFGIKQKPTGVKDPFKLRRHALALVRILTEKGYELSLSNLLNQALASYQGQFDDENLVTEVRNFVLDRLVAWHHGQGVAHDVIASVKAIQQEDCHDFSLRLTAVNDFKQFPQSSALAAANKRVSKLLAASEASLDGEFNGDLFESSHEQSLADEITAMEKNMVMLKENKHYVGMLEQLASLHAPVDAFFEHVMVMADDLTIRHNRLNLLARLRNLFLNVADISLLQT